MKRSGEIKLEIQGYESQLRHLKHRAAALNEELKFVQEAIDDLSGTLFNKNGRIKNLQDSLEQQLRLEEDEDRVMVAVKGHWGSEGEYVLRRITAKSIFLAEPGQKQEMRFGMDGTGPYGTILDVASITKENKKITSLTCLAWLVRYNLTYTGEIKWFQLKSLTERRTTPITFLKAGVFTLVTTTTIETNRA